MAHRFWSAGTVIDPLVLSAPESFYTRLRSEAPVWKVPGIDLALVAAHDLVVDACRRTEDFSNHLETLVVRGEGGLPELFDTAQLGDGTMTLATADPPEHTRHRALVFPELVAKQMATLAEPVEAFVSDQMARCAGNEMVEWTSSVANPVPARTIARVIGLPDADGREVMHWAMNGTKLLAGVHTIDEMEVFAQDAAESGLYLATKLIEAAAQPADDLLGVCATAVSNAELSIEEAVGTLVILLGAGGESTASLIGNATRALAEDQALQRSVRSDRSLLEPFLEEVLRLESPFKGHFRKVRRACELGGVELDQGTTVLLLWAAANRDESAFEEASNLRLDRAIPRSHLAFGRGVHHCVGAPLARLEASTVLTQLLDASDSFSLDPDDPPRWEPSMFVRRHERLPLQVRWT